MGKRKQKAALAIKDKKANEVSATLKNYPVSPRKAVLVADLIRGMEITKAMGVLKTLNKGMAPAFYQLLKSSVANYYTKNQGSMEDLLYIASVYVTQGMTLKRIQPAPQGRAHRILKRYSHIKLNVAKVQVKENQLV